MENKKSNIEVIIPPNPCFKCGKLAQIQMFSGRWVCRKCLEIK